MKPSNKNLLKATLIFLAVIIAVTGILVFMKTRVQPPKRITFVNQYTDNIHQESVKLENVTEKELKNDFKLILNRIEMMQRENLITEEERTASINEYLNAYVPAFRTWCEDKFNQSVWSQSNLSFMRQRINEIKRYQSNGDDIINADNMSKLNEVENILTKYYAAWKLEKISIHNSQESRINLNKAKEYKQDPHLSKCTALMNSLNRLTSRYQQSHYNYVNKLVQKLDMSNYPTKYTMNEWAENYTTAKSAINDYNSVASSLYGVSTDSFDLVEYKRAAKYGFREMISAWDPSDNDIRRTYNNIFN